MADLYDATKDNRAGMAQTAGSSARHGIVVTPSDTKDVTNATGDNAPGYMKALWVGTGGNINVVFAGDQSNGGQGTAVLLSNVPAGRLEMQFRRIMATSTAALLMVGLYD